MTINFFNRITASLPGAVAYSILAGGIGSMILAIFFSGILSLDSLAKFIPWILGFNSAITGYSLMDKTRDRLPNTWICAFASGVIMILLVCLLLTLTIYFGTLITAPRLLLYCLIGPVFSGIGGWLATKQLNMK